MVEEGEGERGTDEWRGSAESRDRLGGETESRWQSWHLSYTEICLEPFSTCLFFFPFVLRGMPKNDTQVLTLCDHAFPELFAHNGMPHPYKTPLKSFHSVSPSPCKQTEGAFSPGESVVKALICGPHAAQRPADPTKRASAHRQLPLWGRHSRPSYLSPPCPPLLLTL